MCYEAIEIEAEYRHHYWEFAGFKTRYLFYLGNRSMFLDNSDSRKLGYGCGVE